MNSVNLIEDPMGGFDKSNDDAMVLLKLLLFFEQQSTAALDMYTREILQEEAAEIAEELDVPLSYVVNTLCKLGDNFDVFSRSIFPMIDIDEVKISMKLRGLRELILAPTMSDAKAMVLLNVSFSVVNAIRCYESMFHSKNSLIKRAAFCG